VDKWFQPNWEAKHLERRQWRLKMAGPRLLFTYTNANQATTYTCNTRPRVSPHHIVNHSSHQGATIHRSSDALVLNPSVSQSLREIGRERGRGGRREGGARSSPGHRTHAGEAAPNADARAPLRPRKERNRQS
jgi:hypothetical protein